MTGEPRDATVVVVVVVWWSGRGRGWDGGRGGRQAAVVHRVGSVDRVREASRRRSVTASRRQASSVEASKRRSVQGASNSGWAALAASMAAPQTTFGRR
jgi:hypothetical protein